MQSCGAHQPALRLVLGADAFGALQCVDHVNWVSRGDRLVRANRFQASHAVQASLIISAMVLSSFLYAAR